MKKSQQDENKIAIKNLVILFYSNFWTVADWNSNTDTAVGDAFYGKTGGNIATPGKGLRPVNKSFVFLPNNLLVAFDLNPSSTW